MEPDIGVSIALKITSLRAANTDLGVIITDNDATTPNLCEKHVKLK